MIGEELTEKVIGAFIEVQKHTGPQPPGVTRRL